jgi:ABC-type branched-subunit amino acid transport system permease subunit
VLNTSTALPHLLVLLIGGLLAALIGSLLLLPVLRTRGHYAAVVTIAFALLLKTFLEVNDVLGGPQGMQVPGMKFSAGRSTTTSRSAGSLSFYMNYFVVSLLLLIGAFVVGRRLERSWIGLNLDALRLDETAASCFGLDIARWKITAFLIGNFLIGIAGALFGMVGGFVAPNNYTFADSLILVSILLLGGIGNPWGVMVATMIVVIVPEKLQTIQEYRFLLYALMVIAVLAVPAARAAAAPGAPLFPGMAAMSTLLEARGIAETVRRRGRAGRARSRRRANEILGLIGPNGSGKTTFFNVVTGIYGADAGRVTFAGTDITQAAARRLRSGISRTFQRSRLSLPLSIFDNIMIGNHKR